MHTTEMCTDVYIFAFGMLMAGVFDILFSFAMWILEKARSERVKRDGVQPSLFSRIKDKMKSRTN